LAAQFREVAGVVEAVVIAEDQVAYLKVNEKELDEKGLAAIQST